MKASEFQTKTTELENYERYTEAIKSYVEELYKIYGIYDSFKSDPRAIIGEASFKVYEVHDWGASLGKVDKEMNLKFNTTVGLYLLKGQELYLITRIKDLARTYKIEEDRYEPKFDKYFDLKTYQYGGWFW